MAANGVVEAKEVATLYTNELDIFFCVKLVEKITSDAILMNRV